MAGSTITAKDGAFSLVGLEPGKYTLRVLVGTELVPVPNVLAQVPPPATPSGKAPPPVTIKTFAFPRRRSATPSLASAGPSRRAYRKTVSVEDSERSLRGTDDP
jgi:hypothetical protein